MTFLKKGKGKAAARAMALSMSIAMMLGTALSAQAATYYKGTAKTKVNLREAPSSKASKAGTLEKGDEVVLVANVKKGNVVNGFTADMAFFKLSTGEYVASQYITAGEAIESDDAGDDNSVPDESGESEDELVADDGGDDAGVAEIDLDTGEISDVEGSGDDLEALDADDDDAADDEGDGLDTPAQEEEDAEPEENVSSSATGSVTADALKVRVSPSMSGTVIKKLSKGESVTITQSVPDGSTYSGSKVSGNWYKLNTGGFVAATFVKVSGSVSTAGSASTTTSSRVATAKADTTMYSKPLELSTEAGTLKKGESMAVRSSHADGSSVSGMNVSGNWYRLSNGNYVMADDVTLSTKTSSSALASETELKAGDVAKTTSKLNLRKGPGTSYGKQGSVAKGASVTIEEIVASGSEHEGKKVSGTWAKLSSGGYVSVGYLQYVSGGTAAAADEDTTDADVTQEELDAALPEE